MIPFILANFVPIMVTCVLAFIGGLVVRFIGKGRQRRGERLVWEILPTLTDDEREEFLIKFPEYR